MVIKSKQQEEREELKRNIVIKPKLKKFVESIQREKAQEAARDKAEEKNLITNADEVIRRASQLSCICFFEKKLWRQYPPYFEMKWLVQGIGTLVLQQEMHADVGGFATYLCREYNNFLKLHTMKRGYLNPLDDANLVFFWQKFNGDLQLLIAAERRRVEAGNKGIIIEKN